MREVRRRATEPFVFLVMEGSGRCDCPNCGRNSYAYLVLQTETPGEPIMYGLCELHAAVLQEQIAAPHGSEQREAGGDA